MGYRGSKSDFQMKSVKEQRVDGNWCFNPKLRHLRCTLMGFERNYQIKNPSKQLRKQYYSTLSKTSVNNELNPWFITGFADAEGCFSFAIKPDARSKLKWRVSPLFVIKLHIKDFAILELIKNTLMVAKIYLYLYINIFLHFNKYPLVTAKVSDYLIFKQCFEIIKQREHLTEKGLLNLIGLKSSLNWGLSDSLKEAFPNVALVNRPEYKFNFIPDPFWVAGFTSGDGSFHLNIKNSLTNISHRVSLRFSINLNIRDAEVLEGLVHYFKTLNLPSTEDKVKLNQESKYVLKLC